TSAAASTINFNGGDFTYSTTPVMTGPGGINFNGGSLTLLNDVIPNLALVGGTLYLAPNFQGGTITNLTVAGVTLSGNYAVSGTFNWAGATLVGRLLVASGAVVN